MLPELYLHCLAHGDFDLALRGLFVEKAPLSAGAVARLKRKWNGECEASSNHPWASWSATCAWAEST